MAFVSTISMRFTSRKDEKVVGFHSTLFTFHLIPSGAIDTVNQDVFGNRFFALAEMSFGMRIITNVSHIEARHKRVGNFAVYYHRRQGYQTFSVKSMLPFHIMIMIAFAGKDSTKSLNS